ncbi:prepilin-type N-terminal cleavage/methylation domain-containing protein [Mesorhizobium sp. 1M-11]|uniref:prepilin-type N-terminal cleavage/methylation domain-containing protein n=1 Tax=Mesorhizobium sp. 1M-11 TaxID=1529006 RepID=UPI0006C767BF|nr:prepilin-type N-terminal cleavage/methylation domain-containing protein [Mesorhizobium sp. 1M-11]
MMDIAATRSDQQGFSLIELMVVLAIFALMATIAVPAISHRTREPGLRQLGQQLTAQLRVAHTMAIAAGQAQKIDFNPATGTVHFESGKKTILPEGTKMTLTTGLETTKSHHDATLTFLPNGSSSGMVVDLETKGGGLKIEVNWLTGAITSTEIP